MSTTTTKTEPSMYALFASEAGWEVTEDYAFAETLEATETSIYNGDCVIQIVKGPGSTQARVFTYEMGFIDGELQVSDFNQVAYSENQAEIVGWIVLHSQNRLGGHPVNI